jgi:hypothetical protein
MEKLEPLYIVDGVNTVENKWRVLIKLKIEFPYGPAIVLPDVSEGIEISISKRYQQSVFIAKSFTIAKI